MNKDIDIVIYGATGFTGQLCVKYLKSVDDGITWAIAGRNKAKLDEVAKNNDVEVEIIVADCED